MHIRVRGSHLTNAYPNAGRVGLIYVRMRSYERELRASVARVVADIQVCICRIRRVRIARMNVLNAAPGMRECITLASRYGVPLRVPMPLLISSCLI